MCASANQACDAARLADTSIEQAQAEMSVLDQWRVEQMAQMSKDPQMRQVRIEVAPAGTRITLWRGPGAGVG